MTSTPPPETAERTPRARALVRVAWIAAAVVVTVLALGVGADYLTASPALCGMCHEMQPSVATWAASAHTTVGCPACHETPRPWYRFPETLAERASMLSRDWDAHRADGTATVSKSGEAPVPDSACLQCHDLSRQVSMRFGTLIDHEEHAKRNKSCVSCHRWTAHPQAESERPLLLMEQCFTCHGRSPGAKAPGTCDVCHPKSFKLRPASHGAVTWRSTHGRLAKSGVPGCGMCHEPSECSDCHGLQMPHPAGWAKAGPSGHGVVAEKNRRMCETCHNEGPDVCGMCHHKGYDPKKGPWIAQHPSVVERQGATFCMDCHGHLYCIYCHTTGHVMKLPAGK